MRECKLTYEELLKTIYYNPETGEIKRLKFNQTSRNNGTFQNNGYQVFKINYERYLAHQLAWYYYYGHFPKGTIDHIDGDIKNNKINNLSVVTRRENSSNKPTHRNGKLVGYGKVNRLGREYYKSAINIKNKCITIGFYNTEMEAHVAYVNHLNVLEYETTKELAIKLNKTDNYENHLMKKAVYENNDPYDLFSKIN